jgi:hypothetical protein
VSNPDPFSSPAPAAASAPRARPAASGSIEQAIAHAARSTAVDFDFLVAQAQVESAMNPRARARTSSATGLYQFIESTWLGTVKRHGPRFGLGDVAAQIGLDRRGSAYVSDPAQRSAILSMRNDPQIAALMAAGLAEDNRAALMPILGREPEHSELYLAHFLGAGGAGRFLAAMQDDPGQSAAALFRRPAAANRAVFYEANGSPRSLAGVMDHLSAKLERAGAAPRPGGIDGDAGAAALAERARYPEPVEHGFAPGNPALAAMPRGAGGSVRRLPAMSALLGEGLAHSDAMGARSAGQVRRAYHQLRALGL